MRYISFVIPCYNSEHTIKQVVQQIDDAILDDMYEIILVNDCSTDLVWEVISDLAEGRDDIVGINLASNFGQHAALMAGYRVAHGDIIVSLDDDGQSPINEVYKLINKLDEGYDVVYAKYNDKKYERRESALRRLGSSLATLMARTLLNQPKNVEGSSFYAMRRYILDEVVRYENAYPFLFGLVIRATRNIANVVVEQNERSYGHSGYTLSKLFSLWMNGFTAFSVKPLRIADVIGCFFALAGFIVMTIVVIRKLVFPDIAIGWSSIMSLMLIVAGITLLMLGLMGEYIGRIYICINKSPQYVIKTLVDNRSGSKIATGEYYNGNN